MKSNIILMGMPFSGKTTVGEILSKRIRYDFIDTDRMIEKTYKTSIPNIFKNFGHKYFREIERKVLLILGTDQCENTIISTGGGMPVFYNNFDLLKEMGITIFLNSPLEVIKKRVMEIITDLLLKMM